MGAEERAATATDLPLLKIKIQPGLKFPTTVQKMIQLLLSDLEKYIEYYSHYT